MPKTLHTIQDYLLGREDTTFTLKYKEDGSYELTLTLPTRPSLIKGDNLEDLTNKVVKALRDAVILQGSDLVIRILGAALGMLPYVEEEILEALEARDVDLESIKQPENILNIPTVLDIDSLAQPKRNPQSDNASIALLASLLSKGTGRSFLVH